MKKTLALLISMLMVLTLFAGCTGNKPATDTSPTVTPESPTPVPDSPQTQAPESPAGDSAAPAEPAQPVTLKWAIWDYDITAYYKALIDAYKVVHPEVTIQYEDLTSSDYGPNLQLNLSADHGAYDIVTIKENPQYVNLVSTGLLLDLDPMIEDNAIDLSMYSGLGDSLRFATHLYQLPFRADFWVTYYNKDIFDRAGVAYPDNDMDFNEYMDLARKVKAGLVAAGDNNTYGAHWHGWRSCTFGIGISDGKNTQIQKDYSYLAPYLTGARTLMNEGVVLDYTARQEMSLGYQAAFQTGMTAMMHQGSWYIGTHITAISNGDTDVTNWGIAKFPHAIGAPEGSTFGSSTGLSIAVGSNNKEAAFEFIKFVTGLEGALVVGSTANFPAIASVDALSSILSNPNYPQDANSQAALAYSANYLEMPLHAKSNDIGAELDAIYRDFMTDAITVEEAIALMNERAGGLQ